MSELLCTTELRRRAAALRILAVDEAIAIGGVERLWGQLMPELAARCDEVVWLLPPHGLKERKLLGRPDLALRFESTFAPAGNADRALEAVGGRAVRILRRVQATQAAKLEAGLAQRRLRRTIRRHRSTHLLYPALFTQRFPRVGLPVHATVHDVNYHPQWRQACEENLKDWAVRSAALLTDSDFTRRELERVCPLARGKTVAVPLAALGAPAKIDPRPHSTGAPVRCYYPATFQPHKGHAVLLAALHEHHRRGGRFELHLTGGGLDALLGERVLPWRELEAARSLLRESSAEFRASIHVLGYVSAGEVEAEYAAADWVVLPSAYEGYGLPLSEAVVRRKRVLCADIPAFREQVRQYGFEPAVNFVQDHSVDGWIAALGRIFRAGDPPALDLDACLRRWTWANVAEAYLDTMTTPPAHAPS